MKQLSAFLLLAVFLFAGPDLPAREGPDNELGIDPMRIGEILDHVKPLSEKWHRRLDGVLPLVSVTHRFPVGETVSGPIPAEEGPVPGMRFSDYLYVGGSGRLARKLSNTESVPVYEARVENLMLDVIEPSSRCCADISLEEKLRGVTIDEIVRMKYDLVIFLDADIDDGASHRFIIPMDVTLSGEAGWGTRASDGCAGWHSNYRLLEASYGPLEPLTDRVPDRVK